MTVDPQLSSIQSFLLGVDATLRAEVERHNDRTMTVVSLSGIETITRCGTCPKEDTRPCTALRRLALPYARHPDYRSEWQLAPLDAAEGAAADSHGVLADGGVPPPYPRIADMPPPGAARRRLLRQFGIRVSNGDFTDEELAPRGIARDG